MKVEVVFSEIPVLPRCVYHTLSLTKNANVYTFYVGGGSGSTGTALQMWEMKVPKLYLEEICLRSCERTKKLNISWVIHLHTAWIQGLAPQSGYTDAGGVAARARGGAGAAGTGAGAQKGGGAAAAEGEDDISSTTMWTLHVCVSKTGCRQPVVLLVCLLEQAPCLHTYFTGRAQDMRVQHGRLMVESQALVRQRVFHCLRREASHISSNLKHEP